MKRRNLPRKPNNPPRVFTPQPDPFADALEHYYTTSKSALYYTREDGYTRPEDMSWYLAPYREFLPYEKKVLQFARGRVLDLGCGAGRHALYLQRKGLNVTAVDSSLRVVALAQERGVRDARVVDACRPLPFQDGEFDSVLLLGNNLGLCGSRRGVARMLRELARVTGERARILATTRAPGTVSRAHREYWLGLLESKREVGAIRLRLDFKGRSEKWISLYLVSPFDLLKLAWENGWRMVEVFGVGGASGTDPARLFGEAGYGAVLEKL